MQTSLPKELLATPTGAEADRILRSCVHCGFCTATCPTYGLLGDELDSPRGRIYLLKNLLEGVAVTRRTQLHLDRCLTCRACETTCPSGVEYGHLLDIGRETLQQRVGRPPIDRWRRLALRKLLPDPRYLAVAVRLGQIMRPLLPRRWRRLLPAAPLGRTAAPAGSPRVLLLEGCVQSVLAPQFNAAAAKVLAALGLEAIPVPGCCGALSQHLGASEEAKGYMRANIDRWWPAIEAGAVAIVSTASGCGVTVKEYAYLLRHDRHYAERAQRVSALTQDVVEVVAARVDGAKLRPAVRRIALQAPCTLQHGQRLGGRAEALLTRLGFELSPVADAHLCCGSAGTYSMLQPALAAKLARAKIVSLEAERPAAIATANIGCYLYLQQFTELPVRHWLELLDVGLPEGVARATTDAAAPG